MASAGFASPEDAEQAFYDAFGQADLDAMLAVWEAAGDIACIHPLGPLLLGYEAVAESWRALFNAGPGMHFRVRLRRNTATAEMSLRLVEEIIHVVGEAVPRAPILVTNVYRRGPRGWRMVLHHASPSPEHMKQQVPAAAPASMH